LKKENREKRNKTGDVEKRQKRIEKKEQRLWRRVREKTKEKKD